MTLGAAGPTGFPDGTAATFNGTSSQITIPGGYFAGTGAESAELWFKTTKARDAAVVRLRVTGGEPMSSVGPSGELPGGDRSAARR